MKFSTRIKEFRKEVNLTQEEFGRIAGVSDKAVSAWENGLSEPRMGAIQKLSTHFSVPKSYILGERTDDQWDEEIKVSFMETFNLEMTIGERIAKRRIELDMTQDDLAQRTGYLSRSSINKIELGKTDLTQTKIVLFAKALATTPAYLMGWDEEVIVSFMETFYLDMLKMFEQLNEEGKEKVIEYVSDLVASGRYSKKNSKDGMVEEA